MRSLPLAAVAFVLLSALTMISAMLGGPAPMAGVVMLLSTVPAPVTLGLTSVAGSGVALWVLGWASDREVLRA